MTEKGALIVNSTIGFETKSIPQDAGSGKRIYTKPYFLEKNRDQFGERQFLVKDLWFGSDLEKPFLSHQVVFWRLGVGV